MEGAALYNQYQLGELPCVLCIHVRIVVIGFISIAILGLVFNRYRHFSRGFHLLNSLVMIIFVERSWQVLAVERGWTFGDCDMNSGLPSWFALDKWFPALFEVHTSCGYSPLILLNISMAEILMVTSTGLLFLSLVLLFASFFVRQDTRS